LFPDHRAAWTLRACHDCLPEKGNPMGRVIAYVIGAVLIGLGGVSLFGAVEVALSGADAEAIAQGFLVPATLFVVGGFVIWMGWRGRGE
jgi:hypothetical protein